MRHSIERLDSTKGYDPSNCVWALPTQQARNTSRNRRITLDGVTLTLVEWSERTGLRREIIADRLNRGWEVGRALTTPKMENRRRLQDGTYA